MVIGNSIVKTVKESFLILKMEVNMMDFGLKIRNMDKEFSPTLIKIIMRESGRGIKNQETVYFFLNHKIQLTMENGKIIWQMVKEP